MIDAAPESYSVVETFPDVRLLERHDFFVDKEFDSGEVLLELDEEAEARGESPT